MAHLKKIEYCFLTMTSALITRVFMTSVLITKVFLISVF